MSEAFNVNPAQVNPFFSSSELTEEQLLAKMLELDKKIAAANRAGAGSQVMEQMWALREMLGNEFRERSVAKFGNKEDKDDFSGFINIG
jgi:hypothetical protein